MACFEPHAVCISSEAHDIPWSSCFERLCFEHSLRHPSLNSKKNWPFDPDKSKQSAANLPPLHWLHFDFPIPDCGKLFHYDGDQQPFPQSWDSFLPFLELLFVSELFHSFCYTVVASALTSLANLCTFIHCIHTCMFLLFLCFMPRQLLQVKNTNPSHEKGWEWVYSNLHIISQKHCQKIYINNKITLTVQLHCMKQWWKTEKTKKTLEILWAVCPSPTCGFPCSTPTAGLSKLPCCKAATPMYILVCPWDLESMKEATLVHNATLVQPLHELCEQLHLVYSLHHEQSGLGTSRPSSKSSCQNMEL